MRTPVLGLVPRMVMRSAEVLAISATLRIEGSVDENGRATKMVDQLGDHMIVANPQMVRS